VACDAAPDAPDDAPALEIGTGTWRFEAVEDGGAVPLVYGAQGGWHLWIALRVRGVEADSASVEFVHGPADAADGGSRTAHGIYLDPPDAEGRRVYLGWPAILRDPACAVGRRYRVEATLRPASGGRISASREVLVGPGDNPPPPCGP
jgi:hypothetical protein